MKKALALLVFLGSACGLLLTPITARQVTPLTGTTQPAHVIWLVDTSGSMADPVEPATCPAGCGAQFACPSTCKTWQRVVTAGVESMIAGLPSDASHSLVTFPGGPQCAAPWFSEDHLQPSDVVSLLSVKVPLGGTPTAAALRFVAGLPTVGPGETYVVLATDGLPNCNPNHPALNLPGLADGGSTDAGASGPGSCQCTVSNVCTGPSFPLGCLDEVATVNASHQLADRGIHLLVVGVGHEVSGSEGSFNGLEVDLSRHCTGDAGCQEKLFLAQGAANDFDAPRQRLAEAIRVSSRCTWWLPQEVLARDFSAKVGGDEVTDWALSKVGGAQKVTFTGESCTRLLNDSTLTAEFGVRPE